MSRNTVFLIIASVFLASSALLYLIHYLVFRDSHHIFIYLLGDLAFLPLEVFLVGLVIDRLLHRREQQARMHKLNMVVGAFFSEVGNHLMGELVQGYPDRQDIRHSLSVGGDWKPGDFKQAASFARSLGSRVDPGGLDLGGLKEFLSGKRAFLLGLLENPNVLEHEEFSDLMLAIFHLDEELEARPRLDELPPADLRHIAGDIDRAFGRLCSQWVRYAQHLKSDYPFLFSLVARTHPLQDAPSPVVTGK